MKRKVNKSELIRDLVAKNPGMKASEIIAQLKKDGVVTSAPLVYQTLNKLSSGGSLPAPKKRGRKPNAKVAATSTAVNTKDLFVALKDFVDAAGGLDKAIAILNVFKS